ncbi:MAG: hypothetical protein ACRC33_31660 [Gemmataceae bacterium]
MTRTFRIPLAVCLAALAGCGGVQPLAAVKGQVRYRGDPLAGGTIVFAPDAERGARGQLAMAEIGPDGRFELRTKEGPGCVPGWHRVTVATAYGPRLPDHYRDPDLSGQRVEVRAGVANHCDIRLD